MAAFLHCGCRFLYRPHGKVDVLEGQSSRLMGFTVIFLVLVIFCHVRHAAVCKHLVQFPVGHLARMAFRCFVGKGNVLFVHIFTLGIRGSIWLHCGSLWLPFRHSEPAFPHNIVGHSFHSAVLPLAVFRLVVFPAFPSQVDDHPQVEGHHQHNQQLGHD